MLGAYYKNQYNQAINGLGAYYKNAYNQPINGLGSIAEMPSGMGFGEQTLEAILRGQFPGATTPVQPIGVYTAWGEQEGSIDWQDIRTPDQNIIVYPLSQQILSMASSAAFGHDIGWVGVLTPVPVEYMAAETAFTGRPYKLFAAEGVYRQDDPKPVPQIQFLYWATARTDPDDRDGGRGTMDDAARRLNGQLVFPVQVPRSGSERQHPDLPFGIALGAQIHAAPTSTPPTSVPAPPVAAPPSTGKLLVGTALFAGAAYLGYRYWQGRR